MSGGPQHRHLRITYIDVEGPDSLQAVPSFQALLSDIAERWDIPPAATGATIVGGYR
jgi:hypothetical protein